MSSLVDGADDYLIRIRPVVTDNTPFCTSYPNQRTIPFVYLNRGTFVEWIKNKEGWSKIRLANGSSGWVPTEALGQTSTGLKSDLAAPVSEPSESALRDRGSGAVSFGRGDRSMEPFNRGTGVW